MAHAANPVARRSAFPLFSFLARVISGFKRRADVRRSVTELSKLTDRELDDIGISRGDIRAVAEGYDPR